VPQPSSKGDVAMLAEDPAIGISFMKIVSMGELKEEKKLLFHIRV
jgi:hypothetical protein